MVPLILVSFHFRLVRCIILSGCYDIWPVLSRIETNIRELGTELPSKQHFRWAFARRRVRSSSEIDQMVVNFQ